MISQAKKHTIVHTCTRVFIHTHTHIHTEFLPFMSFHSLVDSISLPTGSINSCLSFTFILSLIHPMHITDIGRYRSYKGIYCSNSSSGSPLGFTPRWDRFRRRASKM